MAFSKKTILIIHSQQAGNQYAGGGTGVNDSEQYWMRKLAEEIVAQLKTTGHDVRLGPTGTASSTYRENVAWVNRKENRGADLLISCHSNATAKAGDAPKGIGVYHHPSSTKGKAFAEKLVPFLKPVSATGRVYRSTITVAEVASTTPPALLVEHEFHDWRGGAAWIRDPKNRTALAKAYRSYIVDMWGSQNAPAPVVYPKTVTLQGRILAGHELGDTALVTKSLGQYLAKGAHYDAPRWKAFEATWSALDAKLSLSYATPGTLVNSDKQALVVLGSGLHADGTMPNKYLRRLRLTLSAAKAYPNAKIIVSGGAPKHGVTEAALGKEWLIKNGIAATRIITEARSASTVGNARYSMAILVERGFTHYAIISDASHLRRAAVLFDAALLQIETADNIDRKLVRNGLIAYKDVSRPEAPPSATSRRTNAYHTAILLGIVPQYEAARKL